ncbi:MAG: 50S ribosomal protein L9 [bacterium]|nr:50S ribosomal protein L9 [bacterium]
MKIILVKDIKGLGRGGEVKDVSDGYARNFLIARGLAVPGSQLAIEQVRKAHTKTLVALKNAQNEGKSLTRNLSGQTFEFILPADPKGNLYAGLKGSEILGRIRKEGISLVDYSPIKHLGAHTAKIKISNKVIEINILIHSAANEKGQKT